MESVWNPDNAVLMTLDDAHARGLLVLELREYARLGYEPHKADSLRRTPTLIGLSIIGGPEMPTDWKEWKERREQLRNALKEVVDKDLPKALGDPRDIEATTKLLRLDMRQPAERNLGTVHDEIDREVFPDRGETHFKRYRMDTALEAVADALLTRESRAVAETSKGSPRGSKRPAATSTTKRKASAAEKERRPPDKIAKGQARKRPRKKRPVSSKTAPTPKPPDTDQVHQSNGERRSGRFTRIAVAGFVVALVLGLGTLAAIRLRDGTQKRTGHLSAPPRPTQTDEPRQSDPIIVVPPLSNAKPVKLSAEVRHWTYEGDIDTYEAQIKIKLRLVNDSARSVDLRTGANARLALAVYAASTDRRRWLSPTRPRYRRSGKWLLVPPNVPGHLLSSTSFESHWSATQLSPHDKCKGDLVFNVPPDIPLTGYNVRLAYRLPNGHIYFPLGGEFIRWQGNTRGTNF
jgi:hypothetical protein